MSQNPFGIEGNDFLIYLKTFHETLQPLLINEVFKDPETCAIISVDVTNGFCKAGALASPRVNSIVEPIIRLFNNAFQAGVRNFVLSQDTHEPDAVEFSNWPAHCVRGTEEAETVDEIRQLPFFNEMVMLPKNSLSSVINTDFSNWLKTHPELDTFIIVGDCTDLCVYQMAMHLRLDADARQIKRRILVPADCVQTYDFPTSAALEAGAKPHPGVLLHTFFLYHLALNGIEVTAAVE